MCTDDDDDDDDDDGGGGATNYNIYMCMFDRLRSRNEILTWAAAPSLLFDAKTRHYALPHAK